MNSKRLLALFLVVMLIAGSLFVIGCDTDDVADEPDEDPVDEPEEIDVVVTVGSKEWTESMTLGFIAIYALEHHGFEVVDSTGLGGTMIAREALERGDIDLYWEYTGTGFIEILALDVPAESPAETYEAVKEADLENGLVWLDYTPFNNTYTIMMRRDDVESMGIETISQLVDAIKAGDEAPEPGVWSFASGHEYSAREDGYPGLVEAYDFEFEELNVMDLGITYAALRDGEVATGSGFATDGRIAAFDLVNLEDDLNFHAIYNAAPVVRQDILDAAPQIADILNPIAQALTVEEMSGLNMRVELDDDLPSEVAKDWLREKGFID